VRRINNLTRTGSPCASDEGISLSIFKRSVGKRSKSKSITINGISPRPVKNQSKKTVLKKKEKQPNRR
jgi:hypothetical protein